MYPRQYPTNVNIKSSKVQDFIRNHRTLSIIIILAIFGALLIIMMLLINVFSFTEPNGNTVPETAPYTYFEHRYLMDSSLGQDISNEVLLSITSIIVDDTEIASAPEANSINPPNQYTVNIDEETYRRSLFGSNYVFDMKFDVSDGREYFIHILTDENYGQEYIAVIIERIDASSNINHDYIVIYADDYEAFSEVITDWTNNYDLKNPETIFLPLPSIF